jgi:hypothetical protein
VIERWGNKNMRRSGDQEMGENISPEFGYRNAESHLIISTNPQKKRWKRFLGRNNL